MMKVSEFQELVPVIGMAGSKVSVRLDLPDGSGFSNLLMEPKNARAIAARIVAVADLIDKELDEETKTAEKGQSHG
jgi:hypothetical protein